MPSEESPLRQSLSIREVSALIRTRLWLQIIIAMVLGVAVGLPLSPESGGPLALHGDTAAALGEWLTLPGALFLNMIQMVVIPLVATSIILGLTSAGDADFLRRAAVRIVPYFVATTTVAVLIGLALALWLRPGDYVQRDLLSVPPGQASLDIAGGTADTGASLADTIANLIPASISAASLHNNMLQIVVASIFAGAAIAALGQARTRTLTGLLESVQQVSLKIVGWAMFLAPAAVFGLIADFVIRAGATALAGMSAYIFTVLAGLAVLLMFYLLLVTVLGRTSPLHFLKQVGSAQLLAFSTSSSAATMPLSLKTAEDRLDVKPEVAGVIIPLGATVNMDGTALYQVVAAVFIAQMFGVQMEPATLALLIVTVVGASIGSPSTPGVGIVILATLLGGLGIPAEGVAILLGVDRLLDMSRTALNVTGDLTACVIMNRWL
ncbi:MAG: C4-dicarboxylate transporter [Alcanivorax sp.]|nr:C4-dicarboxylate transporter [Alcanivorax sp.]MAY10014.1 C4-dicarboxylate transporter [Alcanivorax sp.]MBI54682.1 C4-dicarboxylate transporter [Alcanivorax sp.]HCE41346.1 dicarboxylate/amino acid:cation symporter [Alcanivorax sp.]|tara:strand:+ start:30742 stop:32055 length:1314 start_codon:yes stop_codon:yes gene_type:complete